MTHAQKSLTDQVNAICVMCRVAPRSIHQRCKFCDRRSRELIQELPEFDTREEKRGIT